MGTSTEIFGELDKSSVKTIMKRKDYEPIKFEIFQSDMEAYMAFLNDAIQALEQHAELDTMCYTSRQRLSKMKSELQHRINCHIERGEWK